MLSRESLVIRPRKWPAVLPLVAGLILFIFVSPQKNDLSIPIATGVLVLLAFILLLAFSKSRIVAGEEGIRHEHLLGSRQISWPELSRTYLKFRPTGHSGSHYWYFEDADGRKWRFRVSLYSRSSLQALAQMIQEKRSEVVFDDRITAMSEGRFPWYIF